MKANLNNADKIIRIIAAIAITILSFTGIISGVVATILLIVAAFLVGTVLLNFCPIYHFLGISTKKKTIQSLEK